VEEATARTFVAAFYSSLARGTELSHEKLEGKLPYTCCLPVRAIDLSHWAYSVPWYPLTDMAEEAATPGGLNEQVSYAVELGITLHT
jgi:hypothetical protein